MDGHVQISLLDMLVEDVGEQLEVGIAHLEGMSGTILTLSNPIDFPQKQQDVVLVLNRQVFQEHALSDIAGIGLRLLHLSNGHIIDALPDPFVPIHAAVGVELHAPQLQVDVLIVGHWVSGEEVKVKGVYFELVLEGYKGDAQLHDLIGLGNVLQLSAGMLTFLYFSKGR